MKTKTFLYVRVSTEEQKKDGYSLPKQVKKLKEYAKKAELTIDVEHEEDESAKDGKSRKLFNKMLKEIQDTENQEFIILCEKVDRLQRNLEDAQTIDKLVKEGKLTLHFSDETPNVYDKNANSHTKLILAFKTILAKFYIDLLSEESRKGVDEKVEKGGYHSVAPPGYRNNKILKILEIDDEVIGPKGKTRAELIQEMFRLYATGKYDVRTLAKEMFSRGLVNRNGNPIGKSRIAGSLKNPLYYGMVTHPRTRKLIKGIHPPLISKELWDKCQEVRLGKTSYKHSRGIYVFKDVIKCGYCGCSIIGEKKKKLIKSTGKTQKYVYYHCSFGSPEYGRACPQPWWTEEEIERQFFMWFGMVYIDEEILNIIRDNIGVSYDEERKFLEAERERLQNEHGKNEIKMRELYEDKRNNVIPVAWFRKEFELLRERQEEIREELIQLEEENEEFMEKAFQTIELCNDLKNQYLNLDIEGKNKLLKMLYRTTTIYNADPEHKYPDVEVVWNEGWDVLYKLRQVELGTKKDAEMKKWLLG